MNLETIKTELEKNQLGFNLTLLQISDEDEKFLQVGGLYTETNKPLDIEICRIHFDDMFEKFKLLSNYNNETVEEMYIIEILSLIKEIKYE